MDLRDLSMELRTTTRRWWEVLSYLFYMRPS